MTKCFFCDSVELCPCRRTLKSAKGIFESRKKEILTNLDTIEINIYKEYESMRALNVPLFKRLQSVNTTKQDWILKARKYYGNIEFCAMEVYAYLDQCTTLKENMAQIEKEFPRLVFNHIEKWAI